jgi:hypothetical protein
MRPNDVRGADVASRATVEIPESRAMIIQRGAHAQRVFEPRGP